MSGDCTCNAADLATYAGPEATCAVHGEPELQDTDGYPRRAAEMGAGQVAYEAYLAYSGGVSLVSGAPLPTWAEQAPTIRGAWDAAAGVVMLTAHGVEAVDAIATVRARRPDVCGA